jgi:alkylhydroperoxidase/carboxymuconolactone decarboxylase family protein YurZ
MRKALKERMRQLAAIYVSTATFIDDDEIEFFVSHPKHPRSKEIALRVTEAIEKATTEMRRFRLIPKVKKSSRKDKENLKKK